MKASLRARILVLAGGLLSLPALAQNSAEPPTSPRPVDAVGPRELQNFSLPGKVTRSSEQQPANPVTKISDRAPSGPVVAPPRRPTASAKPSQIDRTEPTSRIPIAARTTSTSPPRVPLAAPEQSPQQPEILTSVTAPASTFEPAAPAISRGLYSNILLWPWLLGALAAAAGGLFVLWRRKPRESYSGASQFGLRTPAEPVRAPVPRPQPPAQPQPPSRPQPQTRVVAPPREPSAPAGIVAAGLRPSIEIGVQPLRCVVEGDRVVLEFEVELFNAGTAPARGVLAEASLLNAGAMQGQQLTDFFAHPIGAGEKIDTIGPMKRLSFASQVVAQRSAIEEYDIAGRKAFVPVIAFNALYQWGAGKAQTSAAFLVGRETRNDKLAPLHLDGSQQEFRGLGARSLPAQVRT